jgi:hypothetical protein
MILPTVLISLLLASVCVANAGVVGGRSLRGAQVEQDRAGQNDAVDTAPSPSATVVISPASPSQPVLSSTSATRPEYVVAAPGDPASWRTSSCQPGYARIMSDAATCEAAAATLRLPYEGSTSWFSIPSGCVYEMDSGLVWFNSHPNEPEDLLDYRWVCQLAPVSAMAAPDMVRTEPLSSIASQYNTTSNTTVEP